MTPSEIIEKLGLEPLPEEGGFFRETYRAKGMIPSAALPQHPGDRPFATQIYYLVTPDEFSGLHRVKASDEFFHFYMGDAVEMVQITDDGTMTTHILGQDIPNQALQVCVEAGVWQGTRLVEGGSWALLGCTVAPGFTFEDFEIKTREEFLQMFPKHQEAVILYTRASNQYTS